MKKQITAMFLLAGFLTGAQPGITTFEGVGEEELVAVQADTLKLEECLAWARANFPLLQKQQLQRKELDLELKNIGTDYLPKIFVNGQLTYQSDVPELPSEMFPDLGIPRTQYRAALNLEQTLFDGGNTGARKALARAENAVEQQGTETDWQQLKVMVVNLYFAIAMQDRSAGILATSGELLEAKLEQLQALLDAGSILESDLLRVKAQLFELRKQQSQVRYQKQVSLQSLSLLTGKDLQNVSGIELPEAEPVKTPALQQLPQLQLIELQKQKLEASQKIASAGLIPRLSAFGQGGVAQPNPYNFFDTGFDTYYIVGARLQWNVFDWNHTRRTKGSLELRREMLESEAEQFRRSVQLKLADKRAEISQLEETLEKDREIAEMRASIRKAASAQLDQGTLTSADYLETVKDEQKALLTRQLNTIKLVKAQVEYLVESGNYR